MLRIRGDEKGGAYYCYRSNAAWKDMTSITLRPARLPDDRAAILGFINGSQAYEAAFEPNRRLDATVAEEHLESLLKQIEEHQGLHLIAEVDGRAVGWAVARVVELGLFVTADDRVCGNISELFVVEEMRGRHIGRALISACEDHFRALGLKTVMIGALAGNARALSAYQAAGYSPYLVELRKKL
jgi:GNAT superfamily N-acetyltransferase